MRKIICLLFLLVIFSIPIYAEQFENMGKYVTQSMTLNTTFYLVTVTSFTTITVSSSIWVNQKRIEINIFNEVGSPGYIRVSSQLLSVMNHGDRVDPDVEWINNKFYGLLYMRGEAGKGSNTINVNATYK